MPAMQPLELEKIEEGRFLALFRKSLAEVQAAIGRRIAEYPDSRKGVKAVVTAEVAFELSGDDLDVIAITTSLKHKTPAPPKGRSTGVLDTTDAGAHAVFVRPSGSARGAPTQGRLCTEDGKSIDPETGEIVDAAAE